MRLVLDTNVVASAIYWPGPPRAPLQAAREKRIQIFTSTPMLVELADVLARARFKRKRASLKLPPEELAWRYDRSDGRGASPYRAAHRTRSG